MAHFLAHQIFDDADLWNLIGSADSDASYLLVSQEPVGQLLADAAEHLPEVIDLNDIRVIIEHGIFLHDDAS